MRTMPAAPAVEARAWLVFRLGPHVLCASALDVEGIIEPVRPRPVPFSPPYMLGWFDFRGRVAAVISLRSKFGVQAGRDSETGPYIVARVQGELAAFWVDEVRDVLEAQQANWQPMPPMPGAAAFDCYAIRDGEVILRTTFEGLLRADSVAAFLPAAPESELGAPAAEQVSLDVPVAPGRPTEREAHAPEAAPRPPPAEPVSVEPSPPPRGRERGTSQKSPGPPRSPAPKFEPRSPSPEPPRRPRAPDPIAWRETRARAMPGMLRAEVRPPVAETPSHEPYEPWTGNAEQLPPEGEERPPSWGLRMAVVTVLLLLAAIAWVAWWPRSPEAPAPAPVATARPIVPPEAAPAAVAAPPPAARSPAEEENRASQPAPARTRNLTIQGERFTMTVDRKTPPAAATPETQAGPVPTANAHPEGRAERITHVVVRGDTLSHIAHRYLGDAARYPELARLSRIRNPDLIYPGDLVTIDKVLPRP